MAAATLFRLREVPLGGIRGMTVVRALPQRTLPTVGAWCFLDRFGPQRTTMRVKPHPHTGLQTVTWPLRGDIRHRDTLGTDTTLTPGALNLMTSGAGVAHSEYSVGDGDVELDALQFWIALPEERRHGGPAFETHAELPEAELPALSGEPARATVVLGAFGGAVSPATVHSPLVGTEISVPPGSTVRLSLRRDWEYAILHLSGDTRIATGEGVELDPVSFTDVGEDERPSLQPDETGAIPLTTDALLYLPPGTGEPLLHSAHGSRFFLLGGEPFPDDLVMWWNFVGRSHDEIVAARDAWQAHDVRFGEVPGHGSERIPAPALPNVRLTPRRRRPATAR